MQQQILEDKTFYAGDRRTLWRIQTLRDDRGNVGVRLMRVGARRVTSIVFPILELPDVIKALSKLKVKLGEES